MADAIAARAGVRLDQMTLFSSIQNLHPLHFTPAKSFNELTLRSWIGRCRVIILLVIDNHQGFLRHRSEGLRACRVVDRRVVAARER